MFLTFKWMDNFQYIEHHQKIKKFHFFLISNFTCCKIFALKENHYNKQTSTIRVFLMEGPVCPTKRGNWGGESRCKPKSLNFSLLLGKNITYREIPHIEKKYISNSFKTSLTKIFLAAFIQLHNFDLFGKVRLKLSPLIQNSVQQDYIPESYARYLFSYQKCQKIVASSKCGLSPLPLNLYWKPYSTAKNLLIFPIRKIPLNRFKSFAIESFIYSPSNRNFQVITLCNLHL